MSAGRAGVRRPALALAVVLATAGACSGQPPIETRESAIMSDAPEASRPPPPEVPPVEHGGVRYEQDRVDAGSGDRNGGYLVAVDPRTGERLWRLQVYEVADHGAAGVPSLGLYFRSMRLVPGGDALEIENEAGGRYLVDLAARTSTRIPSSPPESAPSPPAKPKPIP